MIADGTARSIASEWHGGQSSALYAFTSTGAILQPDITREIHECQAYENATDELTQLADYVAAHTPRGPQAGWSDLWDAQ